MVDQTVLAGVGFKYGGSLVIQSGTEKNSMVSNGLTVVACVGPTDKRRLGAKCWTIRAGFEVELEFGTPRSSCGIEYSEWD
jgi:hypothetical protein